MMLDDVHMVCHLSTVSKCCKGMGLAVYTWPVSFNGKWEGFYS